MSTKPKATPVTSPDSDVEGEDEVLIQPAAPAAKNGKTKSAGMTSPSPAPVASSSVPKVVTQGKTKTRPKMLWLWVGGAVVVVAGLSYVGWRVFGGGTPAASNTNTAATNTSPGPQVPRLLDGVLVSPERANTNIYAIMIENLKDSRPPSGLDKASVVYEALAEGGITRFLALFPVGGAIPEIGPVRSARPYYVSWAEEYHPLYVHVGGSPQALTYLKSGKGNVVDFNQFAHSPNFWRDKNRAAPHNLYTSTDKLFLGLKQVAPNLAPTFTSWTFKDDAPIDSRADKTNDIIIDFSSFNYKVTYKYDRGQNLYQRFLGDQEHVTRDGSKITAKNIIVELMQTGLIAGEKQRLEMATVGSGKMLLFRDGQTITGTWKKDSAAARTQFLDDQGAPVSLDRGTTWIEAIPTDRKVAY